MTKPWYQSKTKWAGVLYAVAQALKAWEPTKEFGVPLETLAVALGAFGVRDALGK